MATKAPTTQAAPISNFAAFVAAEVKGGDHAHAYRKTVVTTAFEQAFKGNYSPLSEAIALCNGKAKKARAWLAGFTAAGVHTDPLQSTVKKVPYTGALAAPHNAEARATIECRTHESTIAFFEAFDAVMSEPPKAKVPKAAAETAQPAAEPAPSAPAADDAVTVAEFDADTLVDTIVTAMETGVLESSDVARLRAALMIYDAAHAAEVAISAAQGEAVAA